MAGLAKEFEQLDCWESATEEENIVIYGMDFEDEKVGQRTGKLRCLATYVQRIQTRLVCIAACFGSL